jgi:hypothetical protein
MWFEGGANLRLYYFSPHLIAGKEKDYTLLD